jgi:4a-hydroxytetrahydrobiopterin dehydratase
MSTKLAEQRCKPCEGSVEPIKGEGLKDLQAQLGEGWKVVDEHHLEKSYEFENFRGALDFTNRVGDLAEEESHHPDIFLSYGEVTLKIWTHKMDGLTESDFIFAAKADKVL